MTVPTFPIFVRYTAYDINRICDECPFLILFRGFQHHPQGLNRQTLI